MAFGFVGDALKKGATVGGVFNPMTGIPRAAYETGKGLLGFGRGAAKSVKDLFKNIPLPDIPEVDPRLKRMAEHQMGLASQYEKGLPQLKKTKFNVEADKLRMGLAGKMQDIQRTAGRRGLLYSGIPMQQRATARAGLGTEMQAARGRIGETLQKRLRQMQDRAFKSQIGVQKLEQDRAKAIYNAKLQKALARQQAMAGLGRAGGGLLGTLLGGRG